MTQQYATTPIRTDVSPSLHPDVTSGVADILTAPGAAGPGNRAYAEAREALATLYETIGSINDAEKALLAAAPKEGEAGYDPVMDGRTIRAKHGREFELAQAAQKAFDRASRRYDASFARVRSDRQALEKRLSDAIGGDQPSGSLSSEIRAHFKELPNAAERAKALRAAADAKDVATLRAVFNAPAFLSGLSADEQTALKSDACDRVAPDLLAQLRAVEKLEEQLMQAGTALVARMGKVRAACEREASSPRAAAERQLRALAAR